MSFETAFNFMMSNEVGQWFNPNDPDVIAGLHKTVAQKKKTGYVNHKNDRGGATIFGIAQNSHPHINIETLTLAEAKKLYEKAYWIPSRASEMPSPICIAHFDAAVNHGISRANKLLQQAIGVADDGVFGPASMKTLLAVHHFLTPEMIVQPRRDFFKKIVANRPDQEVFLKGWEARCDKVQEIIR